MARPKKTATVDYFPHDARHGDTMTIMESRWGNDGYAFWFKLLELLACHDSHFIDCRKAAEWEFLTAKTRINADTTKEMLDLLARLEAINSHLWLNYQVVVCEKFLCRIEDAYRRRKEKFPTLETICEAVNVDIAELLPVKTPLNEVSDGKNRERGKRKEERKEQLQQQACAGEQIAVVVKEKRAELERLFPDISLDVALEKLMNRCRGKPKLLDPYERVLKWLQTEFKPVKGGADGAVDSGRSKAFGGKAKGGLIQPNAPDADWSGGSSFAVAN